MKGFKLKFISYPFLLILAFSSGLKEVSHKINGRRNFSIDQSLFLKSDIFSTLKRESKGFVACKFEGES